MIVPTWPSPKLLWGLLAALAVAVLVGLGWYVQGLRAARAALEVQVNTLADQVAALSLEKAIADQSLTEAVKTAQAARTQAADALRKLQDAQDQDSRDWRSTRLPDGVRNALQ